MIILGTLQLEAKVKRRDFFLKFFLDATCYLCPAFA